MIVSVAVAHQAAGNAGGARSGRNTHRRAAQQDSGIGPVRQARAVEGLRRAAIVVGHDRAPLGGRVHIAVRVRGRRHAGVDVPIVPQAHVVPKLVRERQVAHRAPLFHDAVAVRGEVDRQGRHEPGDAARRRARRVRQQAHEVGAVLVPNGADAAERALTAGHVRQIRAYITRLRVAHRLRGHEPDPLLHSAVRV